MPNHPLAQAIPVGTALYRPVALPVCHVFDPSGTSSLPVLMLKSISPH